MSAPSEAPPQFGERVVGIESPVFNERAVRASAGIMFVLGGAALSHALYTGDIQALRAFALFFLVDMGLRLGWNHRFAPSMALGALIVRRQRPEWVGAAQKKLAWSLGFGMALIACLGMGWLGASSVYVLVLCGVCLGLMFLETAFGICVGCELHTVFTTTPPELCPGDVCDYTPPSRRSLFTQEEKTL